MRSRCAVEKVTMPRERGVALRAWAATASAMGLCLDFIGALAAPVIGARNTAQNETLGQPLRDRGGGHDQTVIEFRVGDFDEGGMPRAVVPAQHLAFETARLA